LSITNRWGIYQDSTTDANYLGGSVLIGTTTNAGFKTDINGTFRAVSTVTLSSLGGVGTRMVVADASGVLSTQAIPGGGGISGSGTTNYVAKFTGASSIGNSTIFDDGTNVGIGTITPSVKLQIEGPSGAGGSILFQAARASGFGSTELFQSYVTGGADYGSNFGINVSSATNGRASIIFKGNSLASSGELIFNTNNSNRVQIFSGGNIGIGTTTDAGYKTDIAGTLRTTLGANFATTSGNVGIGLLSATTKLHVNGPTTINGYQLNDASTAAASYILLAYSTANKSYFGSAAGFDAGPADEYLIGSIANAKFHLYTNGTRRLTISNTGNVGIGTTSPTTLLNVSSSSATTVKIDATGATGNATIEFTGPNNYPAIINYGTNMGGLLIQGSGTTLYNFATDGNFTIGNAGVPGFPTNTVTIKSGTAPSSSSVDTFTMYAADITAGNAAAHFRTENGGVIKLYQETTGVAAATFAANTGTAVNDASTFDGYTLNQIVKALRNLGILA
jgi:hypothetical protein